MATLWSYWKRVALNPEPGGPLVMTALLRRSEDSDDHRTQYLDNGKWRDSDPLSHPIEAVLAVGDPTLVEVSESEAAKLERTFR